MRICAISDLHGDLIDIEPCDLVLICGDSVPLNIQSSSKRTLKWYSTKFKSWAESLPCEKVLFIAGNHELGFRGHQIIYEKLFNPENKVTYLCNTEYIHKHKDKEYRIFGTPYCKKFGDWAFMYSSSVLWDLYDKIPENLDILISHDQPFEYGDVLLQEDCPWADGTHIGNKVLLGAIQRKQPVLQFNGHLHSCSKDPIKIGNTTHYNVSVKDEKYQLVYNPLYIDYD